MWWSLAILPIFCLSLGNAANSTDDGIIAQLNDSQDLDCKAVRLKLEQERKSCTGRFINYQIDNDTTAISESDRNCTDLDVIMNHFSMRLQNYSRCFNNNITIIIKSINARLEPLRKLTNDTKAKESFKAFFNDDSNCVQKNGKNIQDKCLRQVITHDDTNSTVLKSSLYRVAPFLHYGKRSCSKNSRIINCTIDVLKTKCQNSSLEGFVLSLKRILLDDQCENFTVAVGQSDLQGTLKKSASTTGIVIGVLVGIIALILAFFVNRKFKKCLNPQSESYRVSFQQQPKESKEK